MNYTCSLYPSSCHPNIIRKHVHSVALFTCAHLTSVHHDPGLENQVALEESFGNLLDTNHNCTTTKMRCHINDAYTKSCVVIVCVGFPMRTFQYHVLFTPRLSFGSRHIRQWCNDFSICPKLIGRQCSSPSLDKSSNETTICHWNNRFVVDAIFRNLFFPEGLDQELPKISLPGGQSLS